MRLDKRLAGLGVGSRSHVAGLVRRGRVTVDGVVARDPAAHVDEGARVAVDGVEVSDPPVLVAWHKPVGVLTTRDDPWGREDLSGAASALVALGLHPVGRLDRDTSGLLLWSRDGALTQHLLHPRRAVPRRYVATVDRDPPPGFDRVLTAGVDTAEGLCVAEDVVIDGRTVALTVREGRHRMVRRMLHNAGASCVGLHRVAYGPYVLGALAVGTWREEDPARVDGW